MKTNPLNFILLLLFFVTIVTNAWGRTEIRRDATIETKDGNIYEIQNIEFKYYDEDQLQIKLGNKIAGFLTLIDFSFYALIYWQAIQSVEFLEDDKLVIEATVIQTARTYKVYSKIIFGDIVPGELLGCLKIDNSEIVIPLSDIKRIYDVQKYRVHITVRRTPLLAMESYKVLEISRKLAKINNKIRERKVTAIVRLKDGREIECASLDIINKEGEIIWYGFYKKVQIVLPDFNKIIIRGDRPLSPMLQNGNQINLERFKRPNIPVAIKATFPLSNGHYYFPLEDIEEIIFMSDDLIELSDLPGLARMRINNERRHPKACKCRIKAKITDIDGNTYMLSSLILEKFPNLLPDNELSDHSFTLIEKSTDKKYYILFSDITSLERTDDEYYKVVLNDGHSFISGWVGTSGYDAKTKRDPYLNRMIGHTHLAGEFIVDDSTIFGIMEIADIESITFLRDEGQKGQPDCLHEIMRNESGKTLPLTIVLKSDVEIETSEGYIADFGSSWGVNWPRKYLFFNENFVVWKSEGGRVFGSSEEISVFDMDEIDFVSCSKLSILMRDGSKLERSLKLLNESHGGGWNYGGCNEDAFVYFDKIGFRAIPLKEIKKVVFHHN